MDLITNSSQPSDLTLNRWFWSHSQPIWSYTQPMDKHQPIWSHSTDGLHQPIWSHSADGCISTHLITQLTHENDHTSNPSDHTLSPWMWSRPTPHPSPPSIRSYTQPMDVWMLSQPIRMFTLPTYLIALLTSASLNLDHHTPFDHTYKLTWSDDTLPTHVSNRSHGQAISTPPFYKKTRREHASSLFASVGSASITNQEQLHTAAKYEKRCQH